MSRDTSSVKAQLSGAQHVGEGLVVGRASVRTLHKLAARSDVIWIERYLPFRPMHLSGEDLGVKSGTSAMASQTGTALEKSVHRFAWRRSQWPLGCWNWHRVPFRVAHAPSRWIV